jgi:hypothetical protein
MREREREGMNERERERERREWRFVVVENFNEKIVCSVCVTVIC